jgi:pectinesterase
VFSSLATAADYYVDPNYAGVDGAPFNGYAGAYKTVAAALGGSGVPSGSSASSPNRVFFAPGTYNTANVTGVSLANSRNNIALVGITGNPDDVVITSTLDSAYLVGGVAIGTTGSASLRLSGNSVSAVGITFANSSDMPYIVSVGHQAVSPQGSYVTGQAQTSNAPAVALKIQGDRNAFDNCKFLGYQDTLYADGGRAYFKNCLVSGDVDFIFSKATAVFDHSTINFDGDHSGGTIVAPSTDKRTSNGMVFLDSTVTGTSVRGNPVIDPQNAANASGPSSNSMYLGRPWGWQQTGGDSGAVFVNTKMTSAVRNVGWLNWNANELNAANGRNDGNPAKDARYAEFNSMDLIGNPLDVSQRVTWSHQLTAAEAAAYTVGNLFAFEGASQYPWFGSGYSGVADPNSPNFSWPAFWGDRNSNNDTANSIVSATYPAPGNPSAYSNPSWTVAGNWDPLAQLAAAPEPGMTALCSIAVLAALRRRSR